MRNFLKINFGFIALARARFNESSKALAEMDQDAHGKDTIFDRLLFRGANAERGRNARPFP